MADDNVVQFPKMKLDAPPQSAEELKSKLDEYRISYSEEISEMLWQQVLAELVRSGCRFDEDIKTYFPSMILILESIRSLHLLTQKIEHPLQDFAKDSIEFDENISSIDELMVDNEEDEY